MFSISLVAISCLSQGVETEADLLRLLIQPLWNIFYSKIIGAKIARYIWIIIKTYTFEIHIWKINHKIWIR